MTTSIWERDPGVEMQLLQVPGRGLGSLHTNPITRRSYWYFITNMKHDVLCIPVLAMYLQMYLC